MSLTTTVVNVDDFMTFLRGRIRDTQASGFRSRVEYFLLHCAHIPLEGIELEHVDAYLQWRSSSGDTPRELGNQRVVCSALLKYLKRRRDPARAKPDDARRAPRVALVAPVDVDGLGSCRATDVSVGGMFFETPQHLGPGVPLGMGFKLPRRTRRICCRARVVHTQDGIGAGVAFFDISTEAQNDIEKYVRMSA